MTTKYVYSMDFTAQNIGTLIMGTIGRAPDEIGSYGNRGMSFTFYDADVTPAERQACLDVLPEFMRLVYSFNRTVVEENE